MSELTVDADLEIEVAQLAYELGEPVTIFQRTESRIEEGPPHPNGGGPTEDVVVERRRVVSAPVTQQQLEDAVAAHVPVPGWAHPEDSPRVVVDKTVIQANGLDAATITARWHPTVAPAGPATFVVNGGAPVNVAITGGVAELAVTSDEPRTIDVAIAGRTIRVEAS